MVMGCVLAKLGQWGMTMLEWCRGAVMTKQDGKIASGPKTGHNADADERAYIRPSERMFRRSRSAQLRRKQAARKDEKFIKLVFSVAGFGVILVGVFYYFALQTV